MNNDARGVWVRRIVAMMTIAAALCAPSATNAAGPTGNGQRIELAKPFWVDTRKRSRAPLVGQMTEYDEGGFELRTNDGGTVRVAWGELEARNVMLLHRRAWGAKPTGKQWLEVGRLLHGLTDGRRWSEQALRTAGRLDPSLKAEADAIIAEKQAPPPPPAPATTSKTPEGKTDQKPATDPLEGKVWGRLTPEESAKAIEELKASAAKVAQDLGTPGMKLYESKFFLFDTDLDAREAARWVGLLDRMYDRLLQMFDIPRGTNIWHGKALIFVFRNRADFVKYEDVEQHNPVSDQAAGFCHTMGPEVRIAFYRQPDELGFATVLVHESTHGFIHRYRSPVHVLSWVNEGLAEWVSYELIPTSPWKRGRVMQAKQELSKRGGLGGFFDAKNIEPWQYGPAYTLTDFMIRQSGPKYVAFFNAIKDGEPWEQALETKYGVKLDRLLDAYRMSLGITTPVSR